MFLVGIVVFFKRSIVRCTLRTRQNAGNQALSYNTKRKQWNSDREDEPASARQGVRQCVKARIGDIPNLSGFSDKLFEQDNALERNASLCYSSRQ